MFYSVAETSFHIKPFICQAHVHTKPHQLQVSYKLTQTYTILCLHLNSEQTFQ